MQNARCTTSLRGVDNLTSRRCYNVTFLLTFLLASCFLQRRKKLTLLDFFVPHTEQRKAAMRLCHASSRDSPQGTHHFIGKSIVLCRIRRQQVRHFPIHNSLDGQHWCLNCISFIHNDFDVTSKFVDIAHCIISQQDDAKRCRSC